MKKSGEKEAPKINVKYFPNFTLAEMYIDL